MAMSNADAIELVLGDKQLAIEKATRVFVASLDLTGDLRKQALAELAFRLARQLDRYAGMATAAISKELRETLASLAPMENKDDDFWQQFTTPGITDLPS